jgi:hypothetical protein
MFQAGGLHGLSHQISERTLRARSVITILHFRTAASVRTTTYIGGRSNICFGRASRIIASSRQQPPDAMRDEECRRAAHNAERIAVAGGRQHCAPTRRVRAGARRAAIPRAAAPLRRKLRGAITTTWAIARRCKIELLPYG